MTHELATINRRAEISLSEIFGMLWRRKIPFLLILVASLGLAALASHRMTRRWHADAEMALIQRDTTNGVSKIAYAAPLIETVDTQMAMLQSSAMPRRTLEWMQSHPGGHGSHPVRRPWTAESLQKAITITNPKETNVIQVSAEADSRVEAAQVADAACQAFLHWKMEMAQQQVRGIAQSLQIRSVRAEGEMLEAERQEKSFKQQHQLTDVAGQEKFLLDQYQAQQTQAVELQKQLQSLSVRLRTLGAEIHGKNAHLGSGSGVRDDALVLSLQSQLNQLEIDRADMTQKVTPAFPGILPVMDAKIRGIRARLSQAIRGILSGNVTTLQSQSALLDGYQETQVNAIDAAAKLAAVNRLRSQMQAQIAQMPQTDEDYKHLVRRVDLTNTLYASLRSALDAARLDADTTTGNVQITQAAIVPENPFRPNLMQNLALAGLVGFFLACLMVILLEQRDRRVRTIADVRRLIPAPVLGSLPLLPRAKAAALMTGTGEGQVIEAYRQTYANLLLALHHSRQAGLRRHPVILITSALPGEGKTVTARHLARAIALSGKRTILVDADLRTPSQDLSATEKGKPRGLAEVLRGAARLEEVITDSDYGNLLFLGRGQVECESADLISHPRMEQTLEALRRFADVVIVDAPACLERTEASFLAPHADCIIQVVGAGRVDESSLLQTFTALTSARPSLMAVFLNFSPERRLTLMSGVGTVSEMPLSAPLEADPAWEQGGKILLSENKTTRIIVQSLHGLERDLRLVRSDDPE